MLNLRRKENRMKPHGGCRAWQLVGSLAVAGAAFAVAVSHAESAGTAPAAAPASAAQDYGPYTCLVGYVWREAVPNDLVCVSPDVRSQAKQDNALAASRRSPNGGPFGPDTCISGYVWREAAPTDHVCVTPATREQARTDNLAAASRRNDLRTSVGASGSPPRFFVRADRINVGTAYVLLYRLSTRRLIHFWRVVVKQHPKVPGGYLFYRTPISQCGDAKNAYFRVQDGTSTRRSVATLVCAAV
jgi:hypothetical protein